MMKTASGKEYVVEGAIVTCSKGSLPTKLKATKNTRIGMNLAMVETDTAPSCFAGTFGICAKSKKPCVIKTLPKWMNTAIGLLIGGGIPVVTMESFLVCTMGAGAILPVFSGQIGGEIAWMLALMDLKYPGLRALLEDPNGSLYLNEGMYELALQFLADKIEERNGSIFLFGLDTENNLMDAYIQAAISRLVASADVSEPGRFLNSLENMIIRAGVKNGASALNLDAKMMEVLRKDCADYAKKVAQGGYFKWQEENRVFLSALAIISSGFAYAAAAYGSMHGPQRYLSSQNRDMRDAEIAQANREAGSVRNKLLNSVSNDKLKNCIGQMYRPGATAGDGGLADAIEHEISTGEFIGEKSHIQKGIERIKNLENIIKKQNLNESDLKIAQELLENLKDVLGG